MCPHIPETYCYDVLFLHSLSLWTFFLFITCVTLCVYVFVAHRARRVSLHGADCLGLAAHPLGRCHSHGHQEWEYIRRRTWRSECVCVAVSSVNGCEYGFGWCGYGCLRLFAKNDTQRITSLTRMLFSSTFCVQKSVWFKVRRWCTRNETILTLRRFPVPLTGISALAIVCLHDA